MRLTPRSATRRRAGRASRRKQCYAQGKGNYFARPMSICQAAVPKAVSSTNRVARKLRVSHSVANQSDGGSLMNFRIRGLDARQFDHLFTPSDTELAEYGAVRRIAEQPRPCRISLTDAKPGDELILVNYEHHAVSSPYRMRFAIYIRRGEETFDAIGEVPEQLRKRTLAVRGFDSSGMMTGREIVEGTNVEAAIERQFANLNAEYLHI